MTKLETIIKWCVCISVACTPLSIHADDFDDFFKSMQSDFEAFASKNEKDFEDFRKKINQEMLEFMKNPWKEIPTEKPKPKPIEPKPIIINYDEEKEKQTPPEPNPRPIIEVVTPPAPTPQPQPVVPIKKDESKPMATRSLMYYGTTMTVPAPQLPAISMGRDIDDGSIVRALEKLMAADTDNLLAVCLELRTSKRLCDWAYARLLEKVAESYYGADTNECLLMWGYLMQQSGYGIRFAYSPGWLHALYKSDDTLYGTNYYVIDGSKYYTFKNRDVNKIFFANFKYPGEKKVSMAIDNYPLLAKKLSTPRNVTVHGHPELQLSVSVNENLMSFYSDYPDAALGSNFCTKWANYANVPATDELRVIYPSLRNAISGKSQSEAANILLKVAQSFEYGYDDQIWGTDRAFFPDETWYYPKSDCEDHAIHFSRLVRDLMGLDVALVYYPGHLSAAVAFTDNSVNGTYIMHNGRKYTFCDATYFYAPVGKPMPSSDSSQATLIDVKR